MLAFTKAERRALERLAEYERECRRPPILTNAMRPLCEKGYAIRFDAVKEPPKGSTFGDTSCERCKITPKGIAFLEHLNRAETSK